MTQETLHFNQARFVTSAPDIRAMPADTGIEIAFAGRSNAGKSSALNTLTRQKNLARTSKTPGRTQLINVFELANHQRFIDLPGYGYAKVPEAMKRQWQYALAEYLQHRESLRGLVVLMDIRHPLRDLDQYLIQWAVDSQIPVLGLLTKADKLKPGARNATVLKCREAAMAFCGDVRIEAFSSLKKIGLPILEKTISDWLLGLDEQPSEDDADTHS